MDPSTESLKKQLQNNVASTFYSFNTHLCRSPTITGKQLSKDLHFRRINLLVVQKNCYCFGLSFCMSSLTFNLLVVFYCFLGLTMLQFITLYGAIHPPPPRNILKPQASMCWKNHMCEVIWLHHISK